MSIYCSIFPSSKIDIYIVMFIIYKMLESLQYFFISTKFLSNKPRQLSCVLKIGVPLKLRLI